LNFADVSSTFKLFCIPSFDISVKFNFTNDTISSLSNVLGTFPIQDSRMKMPLISFEQTIDNISLENLESLLTLSEGRVAINLYNVNLTKLIS